MKLIILAGGRGTRLAEETSTRPKPMVEIGGRPILWHLMQIYAEHGCREFLIACGYRGELIKDYFRAFTMRNSDYLIDLLDGSTRVVRGHSIDWRVGVIDTGMDTPTAGRIRRLRGLVGHERFMVAYGDGLGDIDITALAGFHESHGRIATVTAVRPPARFGALTINGDRVERFEEKPQTDGGWINGGFFVFEPEVFDYLTDDEPLERSPLERLAADQQLMAFRHDGFWQPMDSLRDKQLLESLWDRGQAPWAVTRRTADPAAVCS